MESKLNHLRTAYLLGLSMILGFGYGIHAQPVATNCIPRPDGLISWWRAEGNADDAMGLNPGALVNGTTFGLGEVGQSFTLNGVDQLVQVPDSPSLNPPNALTLEGWVYISAFSANDAVVVAGKDDPYGARQYMLGLGTSSGFWRFRAHVGVPGGYQYFDGATPVQTGVWYHVAMTYDGTALRLYLNGVLDGSLPVTGPITTTANPLLIGGHSGGPWNFNGLVDELSLYNRALSQAEIQGIFNAGSAGKCTSPPPNTCVPPPPGLVGWWRAEGNYSDSVGTNNGTPINSVSIVPGLVGQAFQFVSGPNPRVYIPDSPTLQLTNGLTIEAWLKPNFGWIVLGRGDDATGEVPYLLGFDDVSSLRPSFLIKSGVNNGIFLKATNSLPTNVWVHLAATLDDNSGDMRIYINAQVVAETNITIRATCPLTGANRSVCIGNAGGTAGFPFDGLIDEVSLYSRGLSQAEIQAIYTAGSAGKCAAVLPPTILTNPVNQTVLAGGSTTFSVSAGGTAPLSYQWRFNGGELAGQTGTLLLLTNVELAQAGNYSVIVTNQAGTALSSNAVLTVVASTTNCVAPPPGLVGWWRAEGNYSDSAGTNDGTPLNGVSFVPGLVGQAFQFVSGPNPRVYIPDSPTLELTNGLTIEAWLKPNLGWTIMARGDSTSGEVPYLLGFDDVSSLHPSFLIKSSVNTGVYLRTTYSLPTNAWVHVAATLDDNTGDMRIYVNGEVIGETNTTIRATCPLTGANRSVCIGNVGGTAGFPFDGLIDEASLYSRGLSQAEIQAIYAAGSAGKCAAAVPPFISSQPTDQTLGVGGSATFSVGASGTAPLSYQWRFNGGELLGQTETSLLLTNVQLAQAGNYSVVVTNQAGTAVSSNAVLTVLAPSTNCVSPPPGLVGWWRAEGNYNDSAGTNNGTPINSVSIQPGLVGEAFQFISGPNPRVYIPDSPTLQLTNGLTIEAWLKPNLGWTVLAKGDSVPGEAPFFLGFDDVSSLRPSFLIKSSVNSGVSLVTTNSLPTNVWSHLAATLDDNTGDMRIYINGQVVAETNTTIRPSCPLTGANRSVCIGNVGGTAGFPFDGLIDEVSLYSRGLSQAEIQAIYVAGSAGKCTSSRPPIAGRAFVKVLENEVALIPPYRILDWCFSPDGYPLTITSVSPASSMGASVMLVTNGVVYSAPTNYLGYDQFDYSISDNHGGSASASVIVYIDPRRIAAATFLVPSITGSGVQLNFAGYADRTYKIERAESLDGPWTPLGSVTVDRQGLGTITDANPAAGNAFYRAVFQ